MYSFQWKRRLMYRRSFNAPLASRLSVSIDARKTGRASSSRKPGISTLISTQLFWPWPLPSLCSSPLLMVASSSSSSKPSTGRCGVLPTSALTPTRASVPSSRAMRALPLALGSTSYSARMERKSRGPFVTSRRSGGVWLRVERRNESSAGERLTRAAWGGMAGERRCAVLWGQQWQCGAGAGGDACWSWNFCQAARGLRWVLANQRRCVMAFNSGAGCGSEATDASVLSPPVSFWHCSHRIYRASVAGASFSFSFLYTTTTASPPIPACHTHPGTISVTRYGAVIALVTCSLASHAPVAATPRP
jgi:hypothetical protein